MVLIRTPDSKFFEEAHLVLRTEGKVGSSGEGDMLNEANRIIAAAGIGIGSSGRCERRMRKSGTLGFFIGGFIGSGIVGAIWLLISFL